MDAIISIVTLIFIAAIPSILFYMRTRHNPRQDTFLALTATGVLTMIAAATYFLPDDLQIAERIQRGSILMTALILMISAMGVLVVLDISAPDKRQQRVSIWLASSGIWVVAFIVSIFAGDTAVAGQPQWIVDALNEPDLSTTTATVGFTLVAGGLVTFTIWLFFRTRLPEFANRVLFWVVLAGGMSLGALIAGSGSANIALAGWLVIVASFAGAAYALTHHQIGEVSKGLILAVRIVVFITIGATITLFALLIAESTTFADETDRIIGLGILAFGTAFLFVPLRQLSVFIINRIALRDNTDPAQITRVYSQLIAEVIELDTLVPSATTTLNDLLQVEKSLILLLNQTLEDSIVMLVMDPDHPNDRKTGAISLYSQLYSTLAKDRKPLSQFDIEFAPQYQELNPEERDFFRSLQMSAYAPITLDYTMIGVLAVGSKKNDTAYYQHDLDLLMTLAQQTGIALRNARLVEDLQHLNKSTRTLNEKLKSTNDQLSRMDNVKSDFVTIASHELRTPLAQIRGYTDIVDALNEQGMLDQEQTNNLVSNLRKATERMEELISAMLDVSQLDVDAMDLRFAQTSVESLIRMAIEPLTDAIRQRKLTLSAKGLRGLPTVQADLQRLVQAFRNVIVNAIKFTPDGGKIDIEAQLIEAQSEKDVDQIQIRIHDTGVGIDRTNLEMIFKKFFRAYDPSLHSTGAYKFLGAGPGLGLTITRGVIEGHGGRIWAESSGHDMEEFPGSTFTIVLPVSTPEDAKRVLSFEAAAGNEALGRTAEMSRNTAMRRPDSPAAQERIEAATKSS